MNTTVSDACVGGEYKLVFLSCSSVVMSIQLCRCLGLAWSDHTDAQHQYVQLYEQLYVS